MYYAKRFIAEGTATFVVNLSDLAQSTTFILHNKALKGLVGESIKKSRLNVVTDALKV